MCVCWPYVIRSQRCVCCCYGVLSWCIIYAVLCVRNRSKRQKRYTESQWWSEWSQAHIHFHKHTHTCFDQGSNHRSTPKTSDEFRTYLSTDIPNESIRRSIENNKYKSRNFVRRFFLQIYLFISRVVVICEVVYIVWVFVSKCVCMLISRDSRRMRMSSVELLRIFDRCVQSEVVIASNIDNYYYCGWVRIHCFLATFRCDLFIDRIRFWVHAEDTPKEQKVVVVSLAKYIWITGDSTDNVSPTWMRAVVRRSPRCQWTIRTWWWT